MKKPFVINDKKLEKYLQDYLMDKTDTIPIEKALEEAKKRWPKELYNKKHQTKHL